MRAMQDSAQVGFCLFLCLFVFFCSFVESHFSFFLYSFFFSGAIVGIVVGVLGLMLLAGIVVAMFLFRQHKKTSQLKAIVEQELVRLILFRLASAAFY